MVRGCGMVRGVVRGVWHGKGVPHGKGVWHAKGSSMLRGCGKPSGRSAPMQHLAVEQEQQQHQQVGEQPDEEPLVPRQR